MLPCAGRIWATHHSRVEMKKLWSCAPANRISFNALKFQYNLSHYEFNIHLSRVNSDCLYALNKHTQSDLKRLSSFEEVVGLHRKSVATDHSKIKTKQNKLMLVIVVAFSGSGRIIFTMLER